MPDPVLVLILIASFFAAVTVGAWFKTLDSGLWREARVPLVTGVAAGVLIHFARFLPPFADAGIVLTFAALYVRLTGRESEPSDGMVLGAITGAAAAVPLAVLRPDESLVRLSECILAGAVSGYGITFGLTHVRDRIRQAAVDALTAAVAVGAAWLPAVIARGSRLDDRQVALGAASLIPVIIIATVFKQWPSIRAELRHESALGVIDDEDVSRTAHPLRRLGRGGWHDPRAHREFVRIANRIALRKRQQRNRPDETARIYQLEVIKLRMELQRMAQIDRELRFQSERERSGAEHA